MTHRYAQGWNVRLRQPIDEIDEATARRRFADGPQLAVIRLTGEHAVPDYTLTVAAGGEHVRVQRYDAHGSVVETFDYSSVPGEERLFLDNHKSYVYSDGATGPQRFSQSTAHKAWVFRTDGTATCRAVVKGIAEARVSSYHQLEVSGHWRERPDFGDWDSFGEAPEPSTPQ